MIFLQRAQAYSRPPAPALLPGQGYPFKSLWFAITRSRVTALQIKTPKGYQSMARVAFAIYLAVLGAQRALDFCFWAYPGGHVKFHTGTNGAKEVSEVD